MQRPGSQGWGLDAMLMTLLSKTVAVVKSNEVKAGCTNLIDKSGRIF
jgi:hypothetical protein